MHRFGASQNVAAHDVTHRCRASAVSQRVWGKLTEALRIGDMKAANAEKYAVEQRQRHLVQERASKKLLWEPRFFRYVSFRTLPFLTHFLSLVWHVLVLARRSCAPDLHLSHGATATAPGARATTGFPDQMPWPSSKADVVRHRRDCSATRAYRHGSIFNYSFSCQAIKKSIFRWHSCLGRIQFTGTFSHLIKSST